MPALQKVWSFYLSMCNPQANESWLIGVIDSYLEEQSRNQVGHDLASPPCDQDVA